eukprot:4919594-Prymnesium_polylepis.1
MHTEEKSMLTIESCPAAPLVVSRCACTDHSSSVLRGAREPHGVTGERSREQEKVGVAWVRRGRALTAARSLRQRRVSCRAARDAAAPSPAAGRWTRSAETSRTAPGRPCTATPSTRAS